MCAPYTLAPGESKSEIFGNFAFEGGQLKAALDVADALRTDNVAYAALPKREHIPVLLVTEENPFLEKALAVDEILGLTVTTPGTMMPMRSGITSSSSIDSTRRRSSTGITCLSIPPNTVPPRQAGKSAGH